MMAAPTAQSPEEPLIQDIVSHAPLRLHAHSNGPMPTTVQSIVATCPVQPDRVGLAQALSFFCFCCRVLGRPRGSGVPRGRRSQGMFSPCCSQADSNSAKDR